MTRLVPSGGFGRIHSRRSAVPDFARGRHGLFPKNRQGDGPLSPGGSLRFRLPQSCGPP